MFHPPLRFAPSFLACSVFVVGVAAIPDEADARRFRANFSTSGASAPAARSAGRIGRTTDEIAAETRAESRIDWSHAADKGLDVVKSAIEGAMNNQSGSPSRSGFSGDTLTRLELEACVREANWLDDRQARHDANSRRTQSQRAEIERLEREIETARLYVDRYSQRSVDAFNARIQDHRQRVSHFNNVLLPEIERERIAFNARVDRYNSYCNGKRYYGDDLAAVEAKLGTRRVN